MTNFTRSLSVFLMAGSVAAAAPAQPTQTSTQTTDVKPAPAPINQPAATLTVVPPEGSMTRSELEHLLGPIALYPDSLLANVLAASVYPDEVKQAAAFAGRSSDAAQIDAQSWEDPVKAVAKIPDVIKMMGEYPDWTVALGQAYLTQAQQVMDVVQELRHKAQNNGTLRTTTQQKVIVEQETIYIQSADPTVIYVPSYQPSVVYVDNRYDDVLAAGLIGFTAGVVVGAIWADLDCDWHHGCVGWGWGHHGDVDINIDRNFNGNINIGNNVNVGNGNRIGNGNGNRIGNEGNAWAPNRNKPIATTLPAEARNFRTGNTAANRPSLPQSSSARPVTRPANPVANQPNRPATLPAARPSTPAARPTTQPANPRPQAPAATRMPQAPTNERAQSAFQGGSGTRASSSRGASSRQSASRPTSRPAPSRSAPARSGGGGGRGGGRR